jgi:hypothetical protein
MIIQPIQIWQNDFGYQIPFTLQDGTGNAVNLTGANLTLKVQSSQDPTTTDLTLAGSMVLDDAVSGTCHYAVAAGDFSNPETFMCQISASYGTEVISWGGVQIIVMPALPKAIN